MKKKTVIGKEEIRAATEELMRWRRAREPFAARVAQEEDWYRLRMMPKPRENSEGERFAPTSAWLFNALMQKHADLMENIPTAVCLPREERDEEDAKALSAILPVVLERSSFERSYSDNMWQKLKHGVCAWGVFWNADLENGLGDIDVRPVELGHLYWQPGVRNLQDSRSVFVVERMEKAALRARFPQFEGENGEMLSHFFATSEEGIDEVLVVDWYYKKRVRGGKTVLHYCKFAGDTVLFSSENEAAYQNGWYEHGMYPFVLDVLYPTEDGCLGFGVIALGKDPQAYIDRLDRNLLEYMDWATRVRYFCKKNTGVNEEEFCDLSRRIVEVEGDPDEERLRPIEVGAIDELWLQLKNEKIRELKETTANRDVLQGSPDTGVTAAAAIAALQESGNKCMRDIIAASYRAFVEVARLIVECVRQFYSEVRCFRIVGEADGNRYLYWSNERMVEQVEAPLPDDTPHTRAPIFDIDVRAEKQNAYTRNSYNEMLKDLYKMGVFHEENAKAAMTLLSAMSFQGVEGVRARVAATLRNQESAAVAPTAKRSAKKAVSEHAPEDEVQRARRLALRVTEEARERSEVL